MEVSNVKYKKNKIKKNKKNKYEKEVIFYWKFKLVVAFIFS